MIAGSRCTLLARSGRIHPIIFEITTVPMRDSAINDSKLKILILYHDADPVGNGKYGSYDQGDTEFLERSPGRYP